MFEKKLKEKEFILKHIKSATIITAIIVVSIW